MTRTRTGRFRGIQGVALASAIGASLALAPSAMGGQKGAPPKRQQVKQQQQQPSPKKRQSVAPDKKKTQAARTAAPRGHENPRAESRERGRGRDHDRGEGAGGRGRDHGRGHESNGRDDRGRDHDRDRGHDGRGRRGDRGHDRKPDAGKDCKPVRRHWDRGDRDRDRDCDTSVIVVVNDFKPAPCTDLLGTIRIDEVCVDVRKDHAFEAFREAARCAGYRSEKVKVNGRSYLRIYGCPRVDFTGAGYFVDVIRYHNDVIDIALFRDDC